MIPMWPLFGVRAANLAWKCGGVGDNQCGDWIVTL